MAQFSEYIKGPTLGQKRGTRRYERIIAGYQNVDWDHGNWTGGRVGIGIQAGTNMSIAADTLSDIRGHAVSAQEMQALTQEEAKDIYYERYWLPIKGDDIKSQLIANFLADMKSSGGGVRAMQRALNDLGENVSIDGTVGPETLAAINRQIDKSEVKLNNAFRIRQIEHYDTNQDSPAYDYWIKSLNRDYPELSETAEKIGIPTRFNEWWIPIVGGVLLTFLIALIVWTRYRK